MAKITRASSKRFANKTLSSMTRNEFHALNLWLDSFCSLNFLRSSQYVPRIVNKAINKGCNRVYWRARHNDNDLPPGSCQNSLSHLDASLDPFTVALPLAFIPTGFPKILHACYKLSDELFTALAALMLLGQPRLACTPCPLD